MHTFHRCCPCSVWRSVKNRAIKAEFLQPPDLRPKKWTFLEFHTFCCCYWTKLYSKTMSFMWPMRILKLSIRAYKDGPLLTWKGSHCFNLIQNWIKTENKIEASFQIADLTQIPAFLISDQREITAINSCHQCWLQSSPYIPPNCSPCTSQQRNAVRGQNRKGGLIKLANGCAEGWPNFIISRLTKTVQTVLTLWYFIIDSLMFHTGSLLSSTNI